MAKYLFEARYTLEGGKGVAREGGTGRRAAVAKMAEEMGGKLESFYFAFRRCRRLRDRRSARQHDRRRRGAGGQRRWAARP